MSEAWSTYLALALQHMVDTPRFLEVLGTYAKTFENEFVSLEVHDYLETQLPDLEIFLSLSVDYGDTYKASYFSPSQK